ncbi:acetyltransferase [Bacillus sp. SA1-12]|uniref:acetyltransferase n=1 Tax=Bacillus sp. SA1-12 TaxID=1455638 RepID=UPI0006250DCA|nr:acetyltransferase [Bacillus sp. SA1-12]KKI91441.1 acetyltransferase [Bacillus sp. SA1-12]
MNIAIIGQGGHSKVVRDIIRYKDEAQVIAYLDDKYEEHIFQDDIFYGPITAYTFLVNKYDDIKFVVAIGKNELRKKVVNDLNLEDYFYITLIHPSAILSPSVRIGKGTVIMANTVINSDTVIGNHVIINTGSIVEHDNIVSDFSHVSPNAALTGNVHIGEGVHIGAGATVIPNVRINDWSAIGAGATVIHSIPANTTAVGVPAKLVGGGTHAKE